MLRKISLIFLIIALCFTSVTAYAVWKDRLPLVSPVALIDVIVHPNRNTQSQKIVYGFFPYWNLKYADQLNISQLTHFAYFAVDLNADGSINTANSKKELEPGWNKLNSNSFEKLLYQVKLLGQKSVLVVTAMDPDVISSILNDPTNTNRAVDSIISAYNRKRFDDINIDFEYVGEPPKQTRDNFVSFVGKVKNTCLFTNPHCQIDIDIFADAGSKYRLWDLKALSPIVNRVIVMAYDYHRKSSTVAGPVAPLSGKCHSPLSATPCLDEDIMLHLSKITRDVPSKKIILGIPFYGYEWQTASSDYLSNTYPKTGRLASYARIQSLFSDPTISSLSALWSDVSLSPYLVYTKDDLIYQIHFENSQSLEQKLKLVLDTDLGGIAIWALGYETPYNEMWDTIKKSLNP